MLTDDLTVARQLAPGDPVATTLLENALVRHGRDAFVQAALAILVAQPTLPDRGFATRMLATAADTGHGGAALTEIALRVSAGDGEWPHALDRLRQIAPLDALAAQHLQLLQAMRLDPRGYPTDLPSSRVLSRSPYVALCPGFCTPIEAAHIVSIVMETMEPATIFDPRSGRRVANPIRTSDNAAIGPTRESMVVGAINRRIAALSGTAVAQGEPLTVLRYQPGQQYRLHNDAIPGEANQRIKTVLLYLSDAYQGGETEFPDLGIKVRGRPGDALIFDNVDENGRPVTEARHAGLPITTGTKWLATRWIRAQPVDPWTMR